jgi:hypothetical protein
MSMASQMCQIPVTCIIFCCFFGEFRRSMHVLTIPGVTDFDISWRYRVEHTLIKEKTKNVMYMCSLGVQIPCHCKAMSLLHSLFQPVLNQCRLRYSSGQAGAYIRWSRGMSVTLLCNGKGFESVPVAKHAIDSYTVFSPVLSDRSLPI